jgi:hypothetical protein
MVNVNWRLVLAYDLLKCFWVNSIWQHQATAIASWRALARRLAARCYLPCETAAVYAALRLPNFHAPAIWGFVWRIRPAKNLFVTHRPADETLGAVFVWAALVAGVTRLILALTVTAVTPVVAVGVGGTRAHVRVGMLEAIVAAPDVDVGCSPAGIQNDNFKGCHATWLIPRDLPLRPALQVSGWSGIAVAALFAPPIGISLDNTRGDDVAVVVERWPPNLHANRSAFWANVRYADVTFACVD